MKRNITHFAIDALSLLLMVGMVATGLLLRFVLPPGSGSYRTLWGWGRHDWGDLHFYLAAAVAGIVIVHVVLHWHWVCATALKCVPGGGELRAPAKMKRTIAGALFVTLLAAALSSFVWMASGAVAEVRGERNAHGPAMEAASGTVAPSSEPLHEGSRRRDRTGRR